MLEKQTRKKYKYKNCVNIQQNLKTKPQKRRMISRFYVWNLALAPCYIHCSSCPKRSLEKLSDVECWVCYGTTTRSQGLKLSRTLIYLPFSSTVVFSLNSLPLFFFLSFDCQKKKKQKPKTRAQRTQKQHRLSIKLIGKSQPVLFG